MSETPCKYFLHKIFFQLYNILYTHNLLFLHIQECNLLITKFLNALFIQDTASLELDEVEFNSISLIISKLLYCFFFLPGILYLFHFFLLFYKLYLYLFSIISKTKLLFSCFFLNPKAQYLNHSLQLRYKSLRSKIKSSYLLLTALHPIP